MRGGQVQTQTQAKTQAPVKTAPAPVEREQEEETLEDPLVADGSTEQQVATQGSPDPDDGEVNGWPAPSNEPLDPTLLALPEEPTQAPEMGQVDSALDRLEQGQQAVEALGADPARSAQLTLQLLATLTRGLGLGSVPLRSDASAQQRLSQAGTHGLMEGGEVLIDPEHFDPESQEGRRLLAHEVIHVAQQRNPVPRDAGAGDRAELEASVLSREFASGGQVQQPVFGLPAGHVAADGDILGQGLNGLLSTYQGEVASYEAGLGPLKGPNNSGTNQTKQDRATKVKRYTDGVDGIADEIGDLDAFDDLCDTIEDEPSVYMKHMKRIEQTEPFGRLAEMWQGAKDGGEDSAAMKKAFNYEFEDRGFWAETEMAFDLVEKRAKQEAKRREEVANAEQEANSVNREGVLEGDPATSGGGGAANSLPFQQKVKIDPELAKLMNATVEPVAPKLDGADAFAAVPDAQLEHIQGEYNHAQQFTQEHGGFDNSRMALVLETYKGSAGSFVSGFAEGTGGAILDDQLEKLGSMKGKGLKRFGAAARGVNKVMPAIGLWQSGTELFSADTWTQKGDKLANAWGAQEDKLAALDNSDLSDKDRIGLWLSIIADWLDMACVIVSTASTIISFIQDLLYVLGAIFVAVGLALTWLFGVGIPMVTAGVWMLNTARLLTPVVKVLGIISEMLTPVAMAFRTVAMFMVPGEFLAAEAAALGQSADTFMGTVGKKKGKKTHKKIKEKQKKFKEKKQKVLKDSQAGVTNDAPKTPVDGAKTEGELKQKTQASADKAESDTKNKLADASKKTAEGSGGGDDAADTKKNKRPSLIESVNKHGSNVVKNSIKNKNKYEVGEVKTAKDGRIYTYAKNKKGEKQLLWGKKGGDPAELDKKLEDFNTGSGWWEKKKKSVINAQYDPKKLAYKDLWKFTKSAPSFTSNLFSSKYTLDQACPAFPKVKATMATVFKKGNLLLARMEGGGITGTVVELKKFIARARGELSSAHSELQAAANARKLGESEVGTATAAIEQWKAGLEKLTMQLEHAIAGQAIPRKSEAEEEADATKRETLQKEIAELESQIGSMEKQEETTDTDPLTPTVSAAPAVSTSVNMGPAMLTVLRASLNTKKEELKKLQPQADQAPIQTTTATQTKVKTVIKDLRSLSAHAGNKSTVSVPKPKTETPTEADPNASEEKKKKEDPSLMSKVMGSGSVGGASEEIYKELVGVKTDEEIEKMANRIAAVEDLDDVLPPPAVWDEMINHQTAAALAMTRYRAAHDMAYTAFSAELAILDVAADTKAMEEKAGPMRENIKQSRGPLDEAKSQEQQREAALASMQTESPTVEGWIANLIMEIVGKMSDNEDAMDGKASPGSNDAGKDVMNAGNGAGTESKKQKEQGLAASKQQSAFVDEATKVQEAQLNSVTSDIESLREVHGEEMGVVAEFQLDKAEALAEREAAKNEFVLHNGAFLLQEAAMADWATRYQSKREDLENVE